MLITNYVKAPIVLLCLVCVLLCSSMTFPAYSSARQLASPAVATFPASQPAALDNALHFVGGLGGPMNVAAVDGDLLVTNHAKQLKLVNVEDSSNPRELASLDLPFVPYSVELDGGYAYLSADIYWDNTHNGFMIVDIRDPERPVFVARYSVDDNVRALEVHDGIMYVVSPRGIHVISLADPAHPVERGIFGWSRPDPRDLAVADGIAYVTDIGSGLHVIDVRDPTRIAERALRTGPAPYTAVGLTDGYAYVGTTQQSCIDCSPNAAEIVIFDIRDPANPIERNRVRLDIAERLLYPPQAITFDGTRAYVQHTNAIEVLDTTDPVAPERHWQYWRYGNNFIRQFAVRGDWLYVANNDETTFVAMEGLTRFTVVGAYRGLYQSYFVAVQNGMAYLTGNGILTLEDRVQIIDARDPAHPILRGSVATLPLARAIAVEGSYVYVVNDAGNLQVVDIRNPDAPVVRGRHDANRWHYPWDIRVREGIVFLSNNTIIDARDPDHPVLLATFGAYGTTSALDYEDGFLYVGLEAGGFDVMDVRDPARPVRVGGYASFDSTNELDVEGDSAFVVGENEGMAIVDISEPTEPVERSRISQIERHDRIVARKQYVLINTASSFIVYDASDPSNPVLVADYGYAVDNFLQSRIDDFQIEGDLLHTLSSGGIDQSFRVFRFDGLRPTPMIYLPLVGRTFISRPSISEPR